MTTIEEAQRLIAQAEADLASARALLADVERRDLVPKAPIQNYVKFTKYFGYRQYHYAAIRVNGLWHITGRRASDSEANAVVWSKLMEWLVKDAANDELKRLSYKSVTPMTIITEENK